MGTLPADTAPFPHVILFPGPMLSHCIPYMQLARKLCTLGINISLISIEHTITLLKGTKEDTLGGKIRLVALPNGKGYQPSDSPLLLQKTLEERVNNHFENCLKSIMERSYAPVSGSPGWSAPCCAIVDLFSGWVRKIIDGFKLPCYIYWTTTAASLAMIMHAPVLHNQGIVPVYELEAKKIKPVDIPGIPPLHPFDFIGAVQRRNHPMHELTVTCAKYAEGVSGILVNSLYELESSVFDELEKHYVGPISKVQSIISVGPTIHTSVFNKKVCNGTTTNDSTAQKDPVLHWLDDQPQSTVIYISFGSIATLSAAQLVEIASGLETSEQRFIWVVRPPSDPGLVAASSEVYKYLPPGFENRTKERGILVAGWAPQVQILQHPATGGFLTHCGWNSILESIGSAVPMLAWPIQAEQMMNSRWLVDIVGAGLKVHRDINNFVTKDKLEEAVRLLMREKEGQVVKSKVMELRVTLQGAFIENGSSDRNLKSFAEKLHRNYDLVYHT